MENAIVCLYRSLMVFTWSHMCKFSSKYIWREENNYIYINKTYLYIFIEPTHRPIPILKEILLLTNWYITTWIFLIVWCFMSKSTAQRYLKYKKDLFCILFGIDYVQWFVLIITKGFFSIEIERRTSKTQFGRHVKHREYIVIE